MERLMISLLTLCTRRPFGRLARTAILSSPVPTRPCRQLRRPQRHYWLSSEPWLPPRIVLHCGLRPSLSRHGTPPQQLYEIRLCRRRSGLTWSGSTLPYATSTMISATGNRTNCDRMCTTAKFDSGKKACPARCPAALQRPFPHGSSSLICR